MARFQVIRTIKVLLSLTLLMSGIVLGTGTGSAAGRSSGAVYALTNAVAGNAVAVYTYNHDGNLTASGTFATGGSGTGAGLGSQGALVLSENGQWLFAVNAGSNSISTFDVNGNSLALVGTTPSGGERPVSLTSHSNELYVLNAGGEANITGFTVSSRGALMAIPGSTQPLSGNNTGGAQVQFSPNGRTLVVAERMSNMIATYVVDNGVAQAPHFYPSSGTTPFGFAFGKRGQVFVSEAFGGAADASAASSYTVAADGELDLVSGSVTTNQTAACWLVVTNNGRYAYTANAGSGSISGYSIGHDGSLNLLDADGRTGLTGTDSPVDMALSTNNRFLFVLVRGATGNGVGAFSIQSDGSLTALPFAGGLPLGTVGLAAR